MEWILENIEWIFSGIGVFLISVFYFSIKAKKKASRMKQTSGAHSSNFQAGRDINVSDDRSE